MCKIIWRFFKQLQIDMPYDPMIPFFSIYHKELKTGIQTKACMLFKCVKVTNMQESLGNSAGKRKMDQNNEKTHHTPRCCRR